MGGSNQTFENGVRRNSSSSNNNSGGEGADGGVKAENGVNGMTNLKILGGKVAESRGSGVSIPPKGEEEGFSFRGFIEEVKADIRNKDLIPLKILFFFKYATVFVLYPFMTLHLKSLGLTETEAGLNSALIPLVSIFGPPAAGIVADRIGNFKLLLAGITIANAPLALILLLVPKARETIVLPGMMTFSLGCSGPDTYLPFTIQSLESSTCSIYPPSYYYAAGGNFSSTLQCGQVCSIQSNNVTNNDFLSTELPPLDKLPVPVGKEESSYYLLPDQKTFFIPFPTKRPQILCEGKKCSLQFSQIDSLSSDVHVPLKLGGVQYVLDIPGNESVNVTYPEFRIKGGFTFGDKKFDEWTTCVGHTETIRIRSAKLTEVNCTNQCLLQMNRTMFCSNKAELKVYDVALTFGVYTVFRVLLGIASATAFIMFEGAVLAILKEYGGDYGLQRISATFAAVIFAPLSGVLIQVFQGFTAAFSLYTVLQIICAILTLRIDLRFKPPAERILGNLKDILKRLDILVFFVAILISGTAWGYLESFLFWFLQDLGGNNVLMGLTISVGGLAGIPFLIISKPLIAKIGHVNIICVGLLFYGVRLVGYSFIENPWLCLPYEALEALTAALAITAAATYASSLSTQQTIASIQGIWGSLYFGIGRSAGSLFGGYFIKWYGARLTFLIFAGLSFIGAVLYFLLNLFFIDNYTKTKGLVSSETNANNTRVEDVKTNTTPQNQDGNNAEGDTSLSVPVIIVPGDISKFTTIPLDEDVSSNVTFEKVRARKKKDKGTHF